MKTFKDYLTEAQDETLDIKSLLNESHDLTEEQDAAIDMAVDRIMEAQKEGKNLEDCVEEIINEGLLGSIFGGLLFCNKPLVLEENIFIAVMVAMVIRVKKDEKQDIVFHNYFPWLHDCMPISLA